MKKITAIALVLIMSLQCFYQLGVITWFHLNRNYIAEVLCINKEEPITMCYGQCFLDKNLDLAHDLGGDATVPAGNQTVDFPIFLISETHYSFTGKSVFHQNNFHYFSGQSSKHAARPFHPPAFLS